MARTKLAYAPRRRIATQTAHQGPFVRVAAATPPPPAPNTAGLASKSSPRTSPQKHKDKESAKKTKKAMGLSKGHKKGADAGVAKPKKIHRFRPGTVAIRQIKKFQKSTNNVLARAPFVRLIRETTQDLEARGGPGESTAHKFRSDAINALQDGMEAWTVRLLESSNLAAIHGRRVTLMPKDIALVRRLIHV